MLELLSAAGREELSRLARADTLYAFDFDGTLAPIVADPDKARAPESIVSALTQLAQRVPVAVVSGRARADLLERLPAAIPFLVGNHGNEGLPQEPDRHELTSVCRAWRDALESQLLDDAAKGVVLEDKGQSLSIHYRAAADRQRALGYLRGLIAMLRPAPKVIAGKMVLNLLPPGSMTKFDALERLVEHTGLHGVLFVGDDDTDEIVFERAPPHWTTVRIGPFESSRARYFLPDQASIEQVMTQLLADHAVEPLRR